MTTSSATSAIWKKAFLPAIIDWRQDKQSFSFSTEVSINIADDAELLDLLVLASFNKVVTNTMASQTW